MRIQSVVSPAERWPLFVAPFVIPILGWVFLLFWFAIIDPGPWDGFGEVLGSIAFATLGPLFLAALFSPVVAILVGLSFVLVLPVHIFYLWKFDRLAIVPWAWMSILIVMLIMGWYMYLVIGGVFDSGSNYMLPYGADFGV